MDRRVLRALALLPCLVAAGLPAQIVSIELANPKLEAKYSKWLIEHKGKRVICGWPLSGLQVYPEFKTPPKPTAIELAVPDPARPDREILKVGRDGEPILVARDRKCTIGPREWKIEGRFNTGIRVAFPNQNIIGLRDEYVRKRDRLKELEKEWKGAEKASPAWFQLQRRLLAETDALAGWLRNTVFPKAAVRLEKQYKKQVSKAGKDASALRLENAKKSLREAEIDPRWLEEIGKLPGGKKKWYGRQSQHFRIVTFPGEDAPQNLDQLLGLGESVIEHFRANFIDPLLTDGEADPVPEGIFVELVILPDDQQLYNRLYETYYGGMIPNDKHRAKRLTVPGRRLRRGPNGIIRVSYWRKTKGLDPEGIVTNHVGKVMADLVYNYARGSSPAWFDEAWGYWVSFEHIARNTVTSIAWSTADYAREEDKEGKKPVVVGMRETFNALALEKGPSLSKLMTMKLVEMTGADLAKSWSVLDWMIEKRPKEFAPFLRALCEAFQGRERTDLEAFRPKLHEIFGIEAGSRDVYKVLDEEWRAYAAREQARKRKR